MYAKLRKILALVTLSTTIFTIHTSAHQFPPGYFFIQNENTKLILDVDGASTEPGAQVILWRRKPNNFDNQLWTFNTSSGMLINKNSNLILEAPRSGDGSVYETDVPLRQAKLGDGRYQRWSTSDMEIYPENIRWLCITATGDRKFAYLIGCGSSDKQEWSFEVAG